METDVLDNISKIMIHILMTKKSLRPNQWFKEATNKISFFRSLSDTQKTKKTGKIPKFSSKTFYEKVNYLIDLGIVVREIDKETHERTYKLTNYFVDWQKTLKIASKFVDEYISGLKRLEQIRNGTKKMFAPKNYKHLSKVHLKTLSTINFCMLGSLTCQPKIKTKKGKDFRFHTVFEYSELICRMMDEFIRLSEKYPELETEYLKNIEDTTEKLKK